MEKELIAIQLHHTLNAWEKRVHKWKKDRSITTRKIKNLARELQNAGEEIIKLVKEN